MTRRRTNYTPAGKVAVLGRHLVEKVPVLDLCDESGLNPTVLYGWRKLLVLGPGRNLAGRADTLSVPWPPGLDTPGVSRAVQIQSSQAVTSVVWSFRVPRTRTSGISGAAAVSGSIDRGAEGVSGLRLRIAHIWWACHPNETDV